MAQGGAPPKRFEDILEDGYFETDLEGNLSFVNTPLCHLFGYPCDDLLGRKLEDIDRTSSQERYYSTLEEVIKTGVPAWTLALELRHKHRERCHIDVFVSPLHDADGKCIGARALVRDISKHQETAERLAHIAYHDPLTGLGNRKAFMERLKESLAYAKRYGAEIALLFIDLDNFKKVNDRYGHMAGDSVLKAVADRLRWELRESDFIFRFGGDEFAVILPSSLGKAPESVAKRLKVKLSTPYVYAENKIGFLSASIGISLYSNECSDALKMIRNADNAMYRAKSKRKRLNIFRISRLPAMRKPAYS